MTRFTDPIVRILLALFGLSMLLGAIGDALTPHARYRQSRPEAASVLATPPAEVVIRFSREVTADSKIGVVSTVSILPSGEWSYSGGEDVVAQSGFDPNDPSHQSLRAVLRPGLPNGLYRVDWHTAAARGRAERFGSYYFGVGMPVPASITEELGGPLRERDVYDTDEVSLRAVPFVGVLLIALAILLPWFRSFQWHD
ncbi:MAG: copper resistance protein CopC [Planctomycetes bacterium]|nr:copper resistance protein CopC [Planctomycetota bacterium]